MGIFAFTAWLVGKVPHSTAPTRTGVLIRTSEVAAFGALQAQQLIRYF